MLHNWNRLYRFASIVPNTIFDIFFSRNVQWLFKERSSRCYLVFHGIFWEESFRARHPFLWDPEWCRSICWSARFLVRIDANHGIRWNGVCSRCTQQHNTLANPARTNKQQQGKPDVYRRSIMPVFQMTQSQHYLSFEFCFRRTSSALYCFNTTVQTAPKPL